MTVAMVRALRTVADIVAANAAIQSVASGAPSRSAMAYRTVSETTATSPKFARLNAILSGRWREPSTRAAVGADEDGREVVVGGSRKKNPMTAGNSLSENEWVSRRKWTSTTLSSAPGEGEREERPRQVDGTAGPGARRGAPGGRDAPP